MPYGFRTQIPPLRHKAKRFAISIGGETRMGMLTRDHFAELARRCDLKPKLVLAELSHLAEELPRTAQTLADELSASHPCRIYESIVWEIGKLCRKVLD